MKKILATLGLAAVAMVGVTVASTANATPPPVPLCSGWYVNADEQGRKPTQLPDGMLFEGSDLIHRAVNIPLASLLPGSYVATPAPDQPSFLSVEVVNAGGAYGTLRWNANAGMWQITIGAGGAATAGTFSGADPVALLEGKVTKWGAFTPGTATVVSFGVGYTQSPPGTVATKVTSVTFAGQQYLTYCLPPASGSSSASASASSSSKPASQSPSASASASASVPPTSAPPSATATPSSTPPVVTRPAGLPLTGAPLVAIGTAGVLLIIAGGLALWLLKRRDDQFEA